MMQDLWFIVRFLLLIPETEMEPTLLTLPTLLKVVSLSMSSNILMALAYQIVLIHILLIGTMARISAFLPVQIKEATLVPHSMVVWMIANLTSSDMKMISSTVTSSSTPLKDVVLMNTSFQTAPVFNLQGALLFIAVSVTPVIKLLSADFPVMMGIIIIPLGKTVCLSVSLNLEDFNTVFPYALRPTPLTLIHVSPWWANPINWETLVSRLVLMGSMMDLEVGSAVDSAMIACTSIMSMAVFTSVSQNIEGLNMRFLSVISTNRTRPKDVIRRLNSNTPMDPA